MRPITFSRQFPGYHPRAKEPTFFVEKILRQLDIDYRDKIYLKQLFWLNRDLPVTQFYIEQFFEGLNPEISHKKCHTIRARHRWKQGQSFSPRIWSGRPYFSPQIIFAPDIELKKVWEFEIHDATSYVNYNTVHFMEGYKKLSANDGLSVEDFLDWFKFPQPFSGQIICFDKNINY